MKAQIALAAALLFSGWSAKGYTTLSNGNVTNYTFSANQTYYISGIPLLWGTTTVESGAVLKYATNGGCLIVRGDFICATSSDRPAVFTAIDDNTVGETISGSTGNPTNSYGRADNGYLLVVNPNPLTNLVFSYATKAIVVESTEEAVVLVRHVQFFNCQQALAVPGIDPEDPDLWRRRIFHLQNVLVQNASSVVSGFTVSVQAQHLTVNQCAQLVDISIEALDDAELQIDNSLLTSVSYGIVQNIWAQNTTVLTNASGVFTNGGGGNYYLAGNTYRNVGTTNIDTELLADIRQMTTYAPPQSTVDTNQPDIGFHYPVVTDFDLDGMQDGWEWKHFGSLSQAAAADYDGDGTNNLQEYSNGSDPNSIGCSSRFAAMYVNSNNVPVTISVLRGVASQMAVLVNSTNFEAASWGDFTAGVSVNLGTTDGVYNVRIGLKGRAEDSEQIWISTRIVRDTTLPSLILTNLVSTNLTRRLIQLQGYCPEPITSLRFDLTNAAGLVSNRPAFVTDQYFDYDALVFTTNWFQCYDLNLTNGVNFVTLHLADLAGNVTNWQCALNYDFDTNPPTIKLYWPQNGINIAGANLTWRGWVDDPLARVTGCVIGGGATNWINGLVERGGRFWVEGLPVASGTNFLSLTVTNSAGISATTNITVVKSAVEITLSEPAEASLTAPFINLSGTINTGGYAVWANGVRATLNGSEWNANNVPLPSGGTAVIQTRAIPDSDNSGNGSGGSGGATANYENLGNPSSSSAAAAESEPLQTDKPPVIRVVSHSRHTEIELKGPGGTSASEQIIPWQIFRQTTGTFHHFGTGDGHSFDSMTTNIWPACAWETGCGEGTFSVVSVVDGVTNTGGGNGLMPIDPYKYYCVMTYDRWYPDIPYKEHFKYDIQTRAELLPGGKSGANRQSLFAVRARAAEIAELFFSPAIDVTNGTRMVIGDLGRADTNGYVYVLLPDGGEPKNVTVTVDDSLYYFWQVAAAKLQMDVASVTFTATNGYFDVLQDTNGAAYATPHWQTNRSHPALYAAGSRIQTVTGFETRLHLTADWSFFFGSSLGGDFGQYVVVRGETGKEYTLWGTNSAGSTDFSTVASDVIPSEKVDIYNPLAIQWSYGIPGRTDYLEAGASANQIYVTWKSPATSQRFHTVADVACRNAIGLTTESNIVSGIWSDFEDRQVPRWNESQGMKYWGEFALSNVLAHPEIQICFTTADLVKYADGRCGAWQKFFEDVLALHNIASTPHGIVPPDKFSPMVITPTLPGQNNAAPWNVFPDHAVNSKGKFIYDPSYGTKWESQLAWEDASAVFYYRDGLAPAGIYDTKGTNETQWFPVFTPP